MREIGRHLGVEVHAALEHFRALERKGVVVADPGRRRAYRIVGNPPPMPIHKPTIAIFWAVPPPNTPVAPNLRGYMVLRDGAVIDRRNDLLGAAAIAFETKVAPGKDLRRGAA